MRSKVGHVVGLDEKTIAIGGPARGEDVLGDRATVDRHPKDPVRRGVQPRPTGGSRYLECPSQQRWRRLPGSTGVVGDRDPDRRPIARPEETRLDPKRGAPIGPSDVRPDPDPVVADLSTLKRCAWSRDRDLIIRVHDAGRGEHRVEVVAVGGLDFVRPLTETQVRCGDLPGQTERIRACGQDGGRDLTDETGDDRVRGRRLVDDSGHLGRNARDQPLTAPAVSPEASWRWKKMNMISGGIVIRRTSGEQQVPAGQELALKVE